MSALELTISVKDLRRLVDPVIASASDDVMLPVLNCVRIETRGKYLVAMATDRFRLAVQRIPGDWPEWSALIPVGTLRSIFSTYKPSRRDADPLLTLSVTASGLKVHGDRGLLDLLDATVTYALESGDFPNVGSLIREAIARESTTSHVGVNPSLLAGLARGSKATALMVKVSNTRDPILITDGEDFVAILMPRRRLDGGRDADVEGFPSLDDWADIIGKPKAKATPKRTRKPKAVAS